MSHDRFMRAFPCIANMREAHRTWIVGEIHHGCVWCRSYERFIKVQVRDV